MNDENKIIDYIFDGSRPDVTEDNNIEEVLREIAIQDKELEIKLNAFRLSAIADQVIREFQEKFPDQAEILDSTFKALTPTQPLQGKHQSLYRAHCKELLKRRLNGEPLKPATDAEIIGALCNLGLQASLQRDCLYILQRLFKKLFPEVYPEIPDFNEDYRDSSLRVEKEFREKFSNLRN